MANKIKRKSDRNFTINKKRKNVSKLDIEERNYKDNNNNNIVVHSDKMMNEENKLLTRKATSLHQLAQKMQKERESEKVNIQREL
jgi:hypothetical protein